MSTENDTPVEPDEVNLDDFAAELFGQSKTAPSETTEEDDQKDSQESDAQNEEDTHSNVPEDGTDVDGADTPADDEDETDTEDTPDAQAEEPKPKKNRFQERIDEVIAKQRETERKLEAALAELAASKQNPEPKPAPKQEDAGEPKPTDLKEDGTEKYPLGEFDPNYLKDLMRHTLDAEQKVRDAERARQAEQEATQKAETALQASWQEKLGPAQERYPDFREKGEQLLGTFEGIDEAYGNYLTSTLMSMDHGPDVLYYLANNPDEAQKIVDSGPQRATVALGRLEARFMEAAEEKQQARLKVSNAPPPPPTNKGSAAAAAEVPDDTDDLDAFSAKLFKKRK